MVASAAVARGGQCGDRSPLFGRSLVHDELSCITEGSNEAGSVASTYFSAASASLVNSYADGSSREQINKAGRLPQRHDGGAAALGDCAGMACGRSSGSRGGRVRAAGYVCGSTPSSTVFQRPDDDPAALRSIIRAFVEAGVRGRRLEVLRRDGESQRATFRLSRQVDAFEISGEGAKSGHTVRLAEVVAVFLGTDPRAGAQGLDDLMPGLGADCVVVDLRDGRCLALRLPVDVEAPPKDAAAATALGAEAFVHCLQLFARELQRERGGDAGAGVPVPTARGLSKPVA